MEQQILSKDKGVVGLKQDKAYFRSGTHINLKSTDVEKLIDKCVKKSIEDLEAFPYQNHIYVTYSAYIYM